MQHRQPICWMLGSILYSILLVLVQPAVASANTGYVSGRIVFWNSNGNYCPPYANCTGNRYPWTQNTDVNGPPGNGTLQPVRNAQVVIRASSAFGGAWLGASATDANGYFTIAWSWNGSPPKVKLGASALQKDGRFTIVDTSSFTARVETAFFNLVSGTTPASPQPMDLQIGASSASANWYFNVYWAAEREWRETYAGVGALADGFTGVTIIGFSDTPCSSSCANGATKTINLDQNAGGGLAPQGRIMHEMGHIADYVLHPYVSLPAAQYCYPATSGTCSWNPASNDGEWASAGFEEAFATYGGNVTFWSPAATVPTTCISTGTCYSGTGTPLTHANLETTSYPYSIDNCQYGSKEDRWPVSHMRFHWDVYDSVNDADGDGVQEGVDCFWCPFANLYRYANGTEPWQIDEPWNSNYSQIDPPGTGAGYDGRGSNSYAYNYDGQFKSIWLLRTDNCNPP